MLTTGTLDFTWTTRYQMLEPDGDAPAPLLIVLHGQGMSGEKILRLLGMNDGSRAILAPDGIYPFEKRKDETIDVGFGWYIYTGDQPDFLRHLERSEAHILRLVEQACERRTIDTRRITILGYSQGGYLAGFTALRNKDVFNGLVLVGSRLKYEFLPDEIAAGQLPRTLVVHAANDAAIRWEAAQAAAERLRDAGGDVHFSVHDEGHRVPRDLAQRLGTWLERNSL